MHWYNYVVVFVMLAFILAVFWWIWGLSDPDKYPTLEAVTRPLPPRCVESDYIAASVNSLLAYMAIADPDDFYRSAHDYLRTHGCTVNQAHLLSEVTCMALVRAHRSAAWAEADRQGKQEATAPAFVQVTGEKATQNP